MRAKTAVESLESTKRRPRPTGQNTSGPACDTGFPVRVRLQACSFEACSLLVLQAAGAPSSGVEPPLAPRSWSDTLRVYAEDAVVTAMNGAVAAFGNGAQAGDSTAQGRCVAFTCRYALRLVITVSHQSVITVSH